MLSKIVFAIYLLVIGVVDMFTSSIHLLLLAAGVVPIFLSLFTGGDISLPERALGLATGLAVLCVSLITREKIGKGDALLLCITGAFLGVYDNAVLIAMAFMLIICYSLTMLARGRLNKSSRVPFAPFVFAGYLMLLVIV